MSEWNQDDLEKWHERIFKLVEKFGLICYPQEFELCDSDQMLGYMAYSGMPSHYPHWSYGKALEKLKTLYDYGVSGLPYEMVINSNPCLAYLMVDNSLLLQILTMAHVYGHNDFFKNNSTFQPTRAEFTIETFKVHADRVRRYVEDPSIGQEKVESVLNSAHALSLQCRRNLRIRKLSPEEQKARVREKFSRRPDEYQLKGIHKREEFNEEAFDKAVQKNPLEPDEDILLFIRDNNPYLSDWEQDLLTIVHEGAQYFIPQIETKIMNEGWASYWHKKIVDALNLPQGLKFEFAVRHNQVLSPRIGGLNPYHLGYEVWDSMRIWYDGSLDKGLLDKDNYEDVLFSEMKTDFEERDEVPYKTGEWTGGQALFMARDAHRDSSFLQQYLNPVIMRRLDLFQHEEKGNDRVITKVADQHEWRAIRDTLVRNVGAGSEPVIKVEDANYNKPHRLLLKHYYHGDGREVQMGEYGKETLKHARRLWGGQVTIETVINQKAVQCHVDERGELRTDSIK